MSKKTYICCDFCGSKMINQRQYRYNFIQIADNAPKFHKWRKLDICQDCLCSLRSYMWKWEREMRNRND